MGYEVGTSTSVERAFDLLDRVAAAGRDGISLAELALTVPTAKSTTHRYVSTLLKLGLMRRDSAQRFHLGVKLVTLATAFLTDDELRQAARPLLQELVDVTRETVHLGSLAGTEMVYIDKVESPQSIRLVSHIGARAPTHCTAIGKCILAYLDEEHRASALVHPLEVLTPHTLTGEALVAEFAEVRRQGFAIDDEENELGVRCLAAPILATTQEPLGAVSVSAPATRLDWNRCVELAPTVIETAREIARRAGHAPFADHSDGRRSAAPQTEQANEE
jgi:DNA-binding IclR family transcriptional regulator